MDSFDSVNLYGLLLNSSDALEFDANQCCFFSIFNLTGGKLTLCKGSLKKKPKETFSGPGPCLDKRLASTYFRTLKHSNLSSKNRPYVRTHAEQSQAGQHLIVYLMMVYQLFMY